MTCENLFSGKIRSFGDNLHDMSVSHSFLEKKKEKKILWG